MYIKLYKNEHPYGGVDLLPQLRITNKAVIAGILGILIMISKGKPYIKSKGTLTWIIK
jgi:hypothetical protein